VINASAYTAVDRAEAEPDLAFRLNRDVVGRMAACCAALRIPFIHISTDYVFDGEKSSPYVETDFRNPVSIYGKSKAEGEIAIEAAGGLWTIFRTAWVFSAHGSNFIKTMIRLGKERDVVSVVADQWGRPTVSGDRRPPHGAASPRWRRRRGVGGRRGARLQRYGPPDGQGHEA
jgi:dTDP-4-dehydrorhamnose reductase